MTGLHRRQSYPVAVEHRKLLVLWASRVDGAPLVGCEVTRHDAEELWHGAATWSLGRNNLKRPGETKTERCKTGGKNQQLIKGNIRMIGPEFKATLTPCGHIWKYIDNYRNKVNIWGYQEIQQKWHNIVLHIFGHILEYCIVNPMTRC